LVAIYDTVNPYAADAQPGFYAQLAAEIGAVSIVDLGCGTGLITRELARQGYRLTGVDPAPGMVDIARQAAYGDRVQWICGDAGRLGTPDADLAIMTGHVAQFFVTDESWHEALAALRAAVRPGGRLAFESRNPGAREWEGWTREARRSVVDPTARVDTWSEVYDVKDGIVSYANHYAFAATGEELVSTMQLRFRTVEELTRSLADAGFAVDRVYGDWDRRPAGPTTRELIVVAASRLTP
jgi:SAM-dependent methyltransferase